MKNTKYHCSVCQEIIHGAEDFRPWAGKQHRNCFHWVGIGEAEGTIRVSGLPCNFKVTLMPLRVGLCRVYRVALRPTRNLNTPSGDVAVGAGLREDPRVESAQPPWSQTVLDGMRAGAGIGGPSLSVMYVDRSVAPAALRGQRGSSGCRGRSSEGSRVRARAPALPCLEALDTSLHFFRPLLPHL